MGSQDKLTGKKFGEHWSGMDDDPAVDPRAQPEGDEQEGEETPASGIRESDGSSSGRSS